jgi:hypothetical protein
MEPKQQIAPVQALLPVNAAGESSAVDLYAVVRSFLIVLARTRLVLQRGADAEALALGGCAQAALGILDFDVPWVEGDQAEVEAWAGQPDTYAEGQIIQSLLCSGLTGIVLGRLKASEVIYQWLCLALQDARDVHLVWGVALMSAQRMTEARACLSRLDGRDELARALIAVSLLQEAPDEASRRLRSLQAVCAQPLVRDVIREALDALVTDEDIAEFVASDCAN